LLYAIFWVGKQIALAILPFAADQIQSVYAKREQLDLLSIGLLLFFLLGPSEEIFWRGFVQRRLGLPVTTALYALVHIWTLNLILIIAAGVAGLLWGWLYQREQELDHGDHLARPLGRKHLRALPPAMTKLIKRDDEARVKSCCTS
jgi:membrane protease YdiL (CAAX protease family)